MNFLKKVSYVCSALLFSTIYAQQEKVVTVPAGTRVMVEMAENLDSTRHSAGHRFRAKLVGNLAVDKKTVAPAGTMVYGILADANKSKRFFGKASLTATFTDITVDGTLHSISTTGIKASTDATAKKSTAQVARGAALGGLIKGDKKGARRGAKVGAGAAILTSGNQVKIPYGTILEFNLTHPLQI